MNDLHKGNGDLETIGGEIHIDPTSVKAYARSRSITAIDRLIGTRFAIWNERQNRKLMREQLQTDTERELLEIAKDARVLEARQRLAAMGERLEQYQENRERVAELALEYLNDEQSEKSEETDEQIGEDWLNFFGDHAEKATTESLRKLLAQILAGEIRKPGTFSRRTIRFIAELDADIIEKFEKHSRKCFDGKHILQPERLDGQIYEELMFLEEMELLSGVGAFAQILINPGSDGYITCPPAPHVVGKLVISAESKTEVRINVINLTRTAQEILRLLPPIDDLRNLTEVAKVISKFASNVSICSIIELLETGIRVQTIKKISVSED